jgi:hypothetical protein
MSSRWLSRVPGLAALTLGLCATLGHAQQVRVPSEQAGAEIPGRMPGGGSDEVAPRSVAASDTPPSGRIAPHAPNLARNTAWPPAVQASSRLDGCSQPLSGSGTTYNVGPGQRYADLQEVPWLSLQAGDVVNVFYRPEPYRSKVGLRGMGTAEDPIVIKVVTDASCLRPVISGENAQTVLDAQQRRYFNKQYSENLGVFLIYKGPQDPFGYRPRHIHFRNLKITGGHSDFSYTAQDGTTARYSRAAAAIYAVLIEGLLVENCEITRNGNGLFVNSKSAEETSQDVTFRFNRIHDNGVKASYYEHNLYVQAQRALYEGNEIGPLIPGAIGSALKDRSSATVVRYNRIVAAARALDLVEIEGGIPQVMNDPYYPSAWVYGNVIVDDAKLGRAFSVKLIHWGGDNDPRYFRRGTLWFYNNTVQVRVDKSDHYYVALFDMPTTEQQVNLRGNIVQNLGSAELWLGYEGGTVELEDTNLITGPYLPGRADAKVKAIGTVLGGAQAGLDAEGRPQRGAPGTDKGRLTPPRLPAGLQGQHLEVTHQYAGPAGIVPRAVRGPAPDLGAFEAAAR